MKLIRVGDPGREKPGVLLGDGNRLDVSGSVSDVMPLDDVVRGVERLATKEGDPIRLVVAP